MTTVIKNRRLLICYFVTLAVIIAITPMLVIGAKRSIDSMCVAPEKWAPAGSQVRGDYDRFARQFEGGDLVILSWIGCTLDDPRLPRFAEAVREIDDLSANVDGKSIIDRVITGESVLRTLTAAPMNLPIDEARRRLQGSLIGADGRTTCAVVVLTKAGNDKRRASIETIQRVARETCRLNDDDLFVAGPPVNGVAIDIESLQGINVFGALSTLITALLCCYCLRSWFSTLTILTCGLFGQGLVLAAVYYAGLRLDAILIIMPSLILVLTVSAGVHLVNYYREETIGQGLEGAAARALSKGRMPCLLAAMTTAIGLGSLAISEITPVMVFGIVAACGVLVTVVVLLLILPGSWEFKPLGAREILAADKRGISKTTPAGWPARLADLLTGRWRLMASGSVLLMLTAGWGLTQLTTSVDVLSLFSPEHRIVRDYEWLERHVGPLVPVEIVLTLEEDCGLTFVQRLELIRDLQNVVDAQPEFGGTMSAVTFVPTLPSGTGLQTAMRTALMNRKLAAGKASLIATRYLHEDESQQVWRIAARASALTHLDYQMALGRLQEALEARLDVDSESSGHVGVTFTGIMPLASAVQRTILRDLLGSFLTAFVLVAGVMMVVLRSVSAGLLSMLPNVFPVALVFGTMGWLDVPIDIGTIMTASVALGIAVDDTLHFLTWFARETASGRTRGDAVRACLRHCGPAMLQTTVICGTGLLVFALSDFVPTQRFAWMMATLLAASLVGDLLFLPALLLSPLGAVFSGRSAVRESPVLETLELGPAQS